MTISPVTAARLRRAWAGVCAAIVLSVLAPPNAAALTPPYDPLGPHLARDHWPELERAAQQCVSGRGGRAPFGDIEVTVTFRPGRDWI